MSLKGTFYLMIFLTMFSCGTISKKNNSHAKKKKQLNPELLVQRDQKELEAFINTLEALKTAKGKQAKLNVFNTLQKSIKRELKQSKEKQAYLEKYKRTTSNDMVAEMALGKQQKIYSKQQKIAQELSSPGILRNKFKINELLIGFQNTMTQDVSLSQKIVALIKNSGNNNTTEIGVSGTQTAESIQFTTSPY